MLRNTLGLEWGPWQRCLARPVPCTAQLLPYNGPRNDVNLAII